MDFLNDFFYGGWGVHKVTFKGVFRHPFRLLTHPLIQMKQQQKKASQLDWLGCGGGRGLS